MPATPPERRKHAEPLPATDSVPKQAAGQRDEGGHQSGGHYDVPRAAQRDGQPVPKWRAMQAGGQIRQGSLGGHHQERPQPGQSYSEERVQGRRPAEPAAQPEQAYWGWRTPLRPGGDQRRCDSADRHGRRHQRDSQPRIRADAAQGIARGARRSEPDSDESRRQGDN